MPPIFRWCNTASRVRPMRAAMTLSVAVPSNATCFTFRDDCLDGSPGPLGEDRVGQVPEFGDFSGRPRFWAFGGHTSFLRNCIGNLAREYAWPEVQSSKLKRNLDAQAPSRT